MNTLLLRRNQNLIVFLLYIASILVIMLFHEPWFDEAESWLIARDSTAYEMIFWNPHYEGHPPLWWLLLAIPAKLGVPYEFGLKSVQLVFVAIYAYLIIFRAPFPKLIRYVLPFTYFLFFQHGVIARPYSMMTVAIILCAMTWNDRNEKPVKFCASLSFLCLTSAFGMLIAGGIAIVWTGELLRGKVLFKSGVRVASLAGLLALALFLVCILLPKPDTYATTMFGSYAWTDILRMMLYFALCIPSETFFTSYSGDGGLVDFDPQITSVVVMAIISLTIWAIVIVEGKRERTCLYLLVPYTFLAFFGSAKYFSLHHLGVVFLLFLFFAWITMGKEQELSLGSIRALSLKTKMLFGFVVLGAACSISWTLVCGYTDIVKPYALGRELSTYILSSDLQEKNWLTSWQQIRDEETRELLSENTHQYNQVAVETNAYLDRNLFGEKLGGKTYLDHRVPTQEEIDLDYRLIKAQEVDYIIDLIDGETWDELGLGNGFRVDRIIQIDRIWKTHHVDFDVFILKNTE